MLHLPGRAQHKRVQCSDCRQRVNSLQRQLQPRRKRLGWRGLRFLPLNPTFALNLIAERSALNVPGFYLHRAAKIEALAHELALNLRAEPPADPLLPQVVTVGSRGMERWLRQRLAVELGIAANIEFPFPHQALLQVFVDDAIQPTDAWRPDSLAWTILALLPKHLEKPEFQELHLWLKREEHPHVLGRDRWSLAREIADVLDRVALHRPRWTQAWEKNQSIPKGPPEWQGVLWRDLVQQLGPAPTVQLQHAEPLAGEPIHVFGVSSMPPLWLHAWRRAGQVRAVHVYQLTPADAYWGDLKTAREMRRLSPDSALQSELREQQNPLLTALGRLARDQLDLLYETEPDDVTVPSGFAPPGEQTVLHTLQTDLMAARPLEELKIRRQHRVLQAGDRSFQVHACHGPTRQVEALREALHGLFAQNPLLTPRDVLVMTPQLERYAPLVRAILAEGYRTRHVHDGWGPLGAPKIPTHIADLGLRTLNPLADLLLRVLEVVEGRLTATWLADFAGLEPVRRRFAFDDEALARIRLWLDAAGARLGADETDRKALELPEQRAYTLAFALDRLALGIAMRDDDLAAFHAVAPFDEMEGDAGRAFGPFAEFCARLLKWRAQLQTPRPLQTWTTDLLHMLDDLGQPSAGYLRAELAEGLSALAQEAQHFSGPVEVRVLAPLLSQRFEHGRAGDLGGAGAVTVCALTPMRSVPFPVVCLLGMDDGAFPRAVIRRGFDAVAAHPQPGDRDPREEDRNLLLEALLSARSHFLIFYTARDPKTDKPLAPAVPIGDLLDAVDWTLSVPPNAHPKLRPRDLLTFHHAVQPFSASGFRAPQPFPAPPQPLRFDARMFAIANHLREAREPPLPLLSTDAELPDPTPPETLPLDVLVRWLRKPVERLLKERIGLYPDVENEDLLNREALELDPLKSWQLKQLVAQLFLAQQVRYPGVPGSQPPETLHAGLLARGQLPPGTPGQALLQECWQNAALAWQAVENLSAPHLREIAIDIEGVHILGSAQTHPLHREDSPLPAEELLDFGAEDPQKPRRLLTAWLQLLALQVAGHPVVQARLVGVIKDEPVVHLLPAPATLDLARHKLADLVQLWRLARMRPLALAEKTSHAFASAKLAPDGDDLAGFFAARAQWEGGYAVPGESADPSLQAVFADAPVFDHPSFAELALRLWTPILQAGGGE